MEEGGGSWRKKKLITLIFKINFKNTLSTTNLHYSRWMYTIHRKKAKELKCKPDAEAQKQISTISSAMQKPKKHSIDFTISANDFDLRTILDRRTTTHRGSAQFIGIDNTAFQSEKDENSNS